MRTIIDDQIRVAKHNIEKGESILKMQESLKRILIAYQESLKLSKEQIKKYQIKIASLEKMKVANLKANPKFKGALIRFSLVLLSPTLTACNKKEVTEDVASKQVIEEKELVTMIPKEIQKKKLSTESFSYNGMDLEEVKGYLSNFINDSLSKGLYADDNNILSVDEDNKSKIATDIVNLYFYLNTKYLDDEIYAIYNSSDIDFETIYESSKQAMNYLLDDTYTVTPDSKLLLDRLFIRNTEYQSLRQMYALMANRNIAKSDEEKEFYAEQVRLNFINMLDKYENSNSKISNQGLIYGLELIKIVDKLSSKDMINDPDLIEQYTKIYPKLLTEQERINYDNHQISLDELENILTEKSKDSFAQKISNGNGEVSKSYQDLVKEITTQIRLSSFRPNISSTDEWLSKEQINEIDEIDTLPEVETSSNDEVENQTNSNEDIKEEVEEVKDDVETNEDGYEQIKRKAIEQAKADIIVYDRAEEDKENIPEYDIPNQPDENSQDKKAIYDYWYRVTFMEERWELVMQQRFGNQVEEPYLSQNERDRITAQAIYTYANELFDTYYPDDQVKKVR